jgi:tight adherence protein B
MKKYYAIAAPGFFLVGMLFYHNVILAAALAVAAFPCRRFYREYLDAKFVSDMDLRVKDLLASLSSSFATGRHLTEALAEALDDLSLIYGEGDKIIRELKEALERLTVGLEPEKTVMFDLAHKLKNDDLRNFTDVYFTCLTTGGDMLKAVRRSSAQIMDKIEIRRGIDAVISQKKYETFILAVLPVVIMGFLQMSSPDYMRPLYGSLTGFLIMTAALGVMGFAFIWGRRITDVKI